MSKQSSLDVLLSLLDEGLLSVKPEHLETVKQRFQKAAIGTRQTKSRPPSTSIEADLCKARIWNGGIPGAQCKKRACTDGFCKTHGSTTVNAKYKTGKNGSCKCCSGAAGSLVIHTHNWQHLGRVDQPLTRGPGWKGVCLLVSESDDDVSPIPPSKDVIEWFASLPLVVLVVALDSLQHHTDPDDPQGICAALHALSESELAWVSSDIRTRNATSVVTTNKSSSPKTHAITSSTTPTKPTSPKSPVISSLSTATEHSSPIPPLTKPVSPHTQPVSPHTQPVSPLTKPVSPLTKPVSPLTKPVSPHTQPVSPLTKPVSPSLSIPPPTLAVPLSQMLSPKVTQQVFSDDGLVDSNSDCDSSDDELEDEYWWTGGLRLRDGLTVGVVVQPDGSNLAYQILESGGRGECIGVWED